MGSLPEFNLSVEDIRARFPLQTRRDVAGVLAVPVSFLTRVLYRDGTHAYYQTWTIRKKSAGTRRIRAPRSGLYVLQSRLNKVLQAVYRPSSAAHGFVTGRSVVTNAVPHANRRYVLNVDIEDFFPSINFGRVRGLMMAEPFGCGDEAATTVAKLACVNNELPIGGPASPVLANMISLRLDNNLIRLAREYSCWYTRYADDLTFSTNTVAFPRSIAASEDGSIDATVGERLEAIINDNGFSVNHIKTRLLTREHRQEVTGLVVNRRPNVRRAYVRNIRAMLHSLETSGLSGAQIKLLELDSKDRRPGHEPAFENVLRGKLEYLAMVRGDHDDLVVKLKAQADNLLSGRPRLEGAAARSTTEGDRVATILHLSDFHFSVDRQWDIGRVIDGITNVLAVEAAVDLVVVTGDIASSGKRDEYELARKFFAERLLTELSLANDRIFFVPGNHDVDRSAVGHMVKAAQAEVLGHADPDGILAEMLDDADQRELWLKRFAEYTRFVGDITGRVDRSQPWWAAELDINGVGLSLAGLCSPLLSYGDSDRGRLILGQPIVNEITQGNAEVRISMMHHPFDYMAEKDAPAIARVEHWSDLILRGHLHSEDQVVMIRPRRSVAVLGAGSAYQGSRYPNGFQLIEVDAGIRRFTVSHFRRPDGDPSWIRSRDLSSDEDGRSRLAFP